MSLYFNTYHYPSGTGKYRYGFNGMEKDDNVKGSGNSYDFGARIYDARLGRWLTVDRLTSEYSDYSPYNFALDNPNIYVDPEGDIAVFAIPYIVEGIAILIGVTAAVVVVDQLARQTTIPTFTIPVHAAYSPDYDWQRRQEKAAKAFNAARDIAISKMIKDNLPPDDNDPDRFKKIAERAGKATAFGVGVLELLGNIAETLNTVEDEINKQIKENNKKVENFLKENGQEAVLTDAQKQYFEKLENKRVSLLQQKQANVDAKRYVKDLKKQEEAAAKFNDPSIERTDQISRTANHGRVPVIIESEEE